MQYGPRSFGEHYKSRIHLGSLNTTNIVKTNSIMNLSYSVPYHLMSFTVSSILVVHHFFIKKVLEN